MKTDVMKTYEVLKRVGVYGIHSFELMREVGTTRVAARVSELKKQGYAIESKRERCGGVTGCRYTLVGTAGKAETKPVRWDFVGDRAIPIYG